MERYRTYPANHEHKVHLIELDEFTPSPSLLKALSVGFKFIPFKKMRKAWFTVYSNHAKGSLQSFVSGAGLEAVTDQKSLNPVQKMVAKMLESPEWVNLHKEHVISNTDKNLDIAIVSAKWMVKHSKKLLERADVFEEIVPPRAIDEICRDFAEDLPSHVPTLLLLDQVPRPERVAYFYPLPRPHKGLSVPARPITGATNTLTTTMSRALDHFFQQVLLAVKDKCQDIGYPNLFTVVTNTEQTIGKVQQWLREVPEDILELHAYDFTDMYTNIDTDAALDGIDWIMKSFLGWSDVKMVTCQVPKARPSQEIGGDISYVSKMNQNTGKTMDNIPIRVSVTIPVQWVRHLTNMVLRKYSYVSCKWLPDRQFRQIKGFAMGTNCALPGANLVLLAREISFFHGLDVQFRLCRYIDDMLVAHPTGSNHVELMKECYDPLTLKFSLAPGNPNPFGTGNRTIYLDLQFAENQMKSFRFGIYTKPLNAYGMFHADSYAPNSVRKGIIIGAAIRILSRNSHYANAHADWILFCKLLNRQGYSNEFIMRTLHTYEQTMIKLHSKNLKPLSSFSFSVKTTGERSKPKKDYSYFVVTDWTSRLPPMRLNPQINRHFPVVPGSEHKKVGLAYRGLPNVLRYSKQTRNEIDTIRAHQWVQGLGLL
jgi:hypothetical protein